MQQNQLQNPAPDPIPLRRVSRRDEESVRNEYLVGLRGGGGGDDERGRGRSRERQRDIGRESRRGREIETSSSREFLVVRRMEEQVSLDITINILLNLNDINGTQHPLPHLEPSPSNKKKPVDEGRILAQHIANAERAFEALRGVKFVVATPPHSHRQEYRHRHESQTRNQNQPESAPRSPGIIHGSRIRISVSNASNRSELTLLKPVFHQSKYKPLNSNSVKKDEVSSHEQEVRDRGEGLERWVERGDVREKVQENAVGANGCGEDGDTEWVDLDADAEIDGDGGGVQPKEKVLEESAGVFATKREGRKKHAEEGIEGGELERSGSGDSARTVIRVLAKEKERGNATERGKQKEKKKGMEKDKETEKGKAYRKFSLPTPIRGPKKEKEKMKEEVVDYEAEMF